MLYFVSDPELESESIRSLESEPEFESEQPHHDSTPLIQSTVFISFSADHDTLHLMSAGR